MNDSSPDSASDEPTRFRYPGTLPFNDSPEDEARFFGRDAAGEQLYLRVLSVSLLVQFAASGRGKTSLLQAFLFPRLRKNKPFLPVMVRLDAPQVSLVDAVARSFEQACQTEKLKFPEVRKDGLWELLSTALVWRGDLLLTPVLVFDQFEEVFTLRDQAFRDTLAEELGALATGVPPERLRSKQANAVERFKARPDFKIVISLREEYLGALEEFSPAIPDLFHERLRLEPLVEEEALRAITRPAGLVAKEGEKSFWAPRFEFDGPALDKMIAYLKGKSGVIEPFTLQLLCRHAEEIARRKGEIGEGLVDNGEKGEGVVHLTLADFNEGEDFEQVLKNFYQKILRKIEEKLGESARGSAEELCEHGLLDREGHRLSLQEGQIRDRFSVDAETLENLRQERLIRREPRLDSMYYEISHDRLADSIYSSRRNKLPKTERDQRIKEKKQLQEEQKLRKEQERLVGRLKRRNFFVSALCVFLGVLIGEVWLLYSEATSAQKKASDQFSRAEKEKQTADKERQIDQALLGFTLGDEFLGDIRDFGHTATLEKVRKETENAMAKGEQQATLIGGLAWRNEGDVQRNQGHVQESIKFYGKALEAIESSPDDPDKPQQKERESARTHHGMGDLMASSGDIGEAAFHYNTEVEKWRDVLLLDASRPRATDAAAVAADCTGLAQALASSGDVRKQTGEASLSLSSLDEALDIVSGLLFGAQSSPLACRLQAAKIEPYPNPKALLVLSDIAMSRADEAAGALATKAVGLMPHSVPAMRKAVYASLDSSGGAPNIDSIEKLKETAGIAEDLQRFDPDSKLGQENRAMSQLMLSLGIVRCYNRSSADKSKDCQLKESLEDAEVMTLDGMATLRALAHSDPGNVEWQADLAVALQLDAKAFGAAGKGQSGESRAAREEAEQIYAGLEREDLGDTGVFELEAALFEDEAEALASLRLLDQAKRAMQRAVDYLKALTIAHEDNVTFKAELAQLFGGEAELLERSNDARGAAVAREAEAEEKGFYDAVIANLTQNATWRDREVRNHFDVGEKSFEGRLYEAALAEFQAAELNELEYLRYAPMSAPILDNLGVIYSRIADTQKKLGHPDEQAAALNRSMHAAEIAAAIDPGNQDILQGLLYARLHVAIDPSNQDSLQGLFFARLHVLDAQIKTESAVKDRRFYESLVATARETVTNADSMMRGDYHNMVPLASLGLSKFMLARVLRLGGEDGWREAIQGGKIQLERAEKGAEKDVKDKDSPEVAGRARAVLADLWDESHEAEDAGNERQLALKDYQLALSRYPDEDKMETEDRIEKKYIMDAIADLNLKLGKDLRANDVGAP